MTEPAPPPLLTERGKEALRILAAPGVRTAAEVLAQAVLEGRITPPQRATLECD